MSAEEEFEKWWPKPGPVLDAFWSGFLNCMRITAKVAFIEGYELGNKANNQEMQTDTEKNKWPYKCSMCGRIHESVKYFCEECR